MLTAAWGCKTLLGATTTVPAALRVAGKLRAVSLLLATRPVTPFVTVDPIAPFKAFVELSSAVDPLSLSR
jgi:hypothetical protein